MSTVKGYAVEDRAGTLLVETVSGTAHAAKVYYLVIGCNIPHGKYDNVEIEWMFHEACELHGTRLVEVSISQDNDR